jgi:hypothetical protein
MENRKGEKIGWVGGWLGGFLWVAVLAVVFLFQGKILQAVSGMGLAAAATACALRFVPWRFPETPYWKLMLPSYGMLSLSVAWAIWAFGAAQASGLSWWMLVPLLSVLSPLITIGKRKWADGRVAAR